MYKMINLTQLLFKEERHNIREGYHFQDHGVKGTLPLSLRSISLWVIRMRAPLTIIDCMSLVKLCKLVLMILESPGKGEGTLLLRSVRIA